MRQKERDRSALMGVERLRFGAGLRSRSRESLACPAPPLPGRFSEERRAHVPLLCAASADLSGGVRFAERAQFEREHGRSCPPAIF
jgi:hypothetical protein